MTPIDIWFDAVWVRLKFWNYQSITKGEVLNGINQALAQGLITLDDLHDRTLVFDTLAEGHGNREFEATAKSLESQPWFHLERCRWVHNVCDPIDPRFKAISWPWFMVNFSEFLDHVDGLSINWQSLRMQKDFVCLMRRPSRLRSRVAKEILNRYPSEAYVLSYGSELMTKQFDRVIRQEIPILIDGQTPHVSGSDGLQQRASDVRFFSNLINLVVETSEQLEYDWFYWHTQFITEKTFKCFAWRQMPIWWAVPGLVDHVRSMGFDVFDDWFADHVYDSLLDGEDRFEKVFQCLDQALTKAHNLGLDHARQQIWSRLDGNYQHLKRLNSRHMDNWKYIKDHVSK